MTANPKAEYEKLKVQFPDVTFWTFAGRSGGKRIKGQMFARGVAVPVWDRKLAILLKRLPYMKRVSEADLGFSVEAAKQREASVTVPANWRELHHKRRIALARQLSNEDIRTSARADEILEKFAPAETPLEAPPAPADPVAHG